MDAAVVIPQIHILAAFPALLFVGGLGQHRDTAASTAVNDIDRDAPILNHILETCQQYGGHPLSKPVDGILMCFEAAEQAVKYASQLQIAQTDLAGLSPNDKICPPRIGIYIGDLQFDRPTSDWFTNNYESSIAVKLARDASPGGIVLARTVYDIASCRLTLRSTQIDSSDLVTFEQSNSVFAAAVREIASPSAVVSVFETGPWPVESSAMTALPSVRAASKPSGAAPSSSQTHLSTPNTPDRESPNRSVLNHAESVPSLGDIFSPALAPSLLSPPPETAPPTNRPPRVQQSRTPSRPIAGSHSNPVSSGSRGTFILSEFRREQLLSALAEHVGPIAGFTISQAEATATSPEELVESLLEVVPKRNRATFRALALHVVRQESNSEDLASSSHPWELL